MNEKLAKKIRRKAREAALDVGIPEETTYVIRPNRVRFEGAQNTNLRPLSEETIARRDQKRDFARAARAGVLHDWLLSGVFNELNVVRPQVVLGSCLRGVYQRTKRALT